MVTMIDLFTLGLIDIWSNIKSLFYKFLYVLKVVVIVITLGKARPKLTKFDHQIDTIYQHATEAEIKKLGELARVGGDGYLAELERLTRKYKDS